MAHFRLYKLVLILGLVVTLSMGCAGTDEAQNDEEELELSDVTGQWEYQSSAGSVLERGRIVLQEDGTRLRGMLVDNRLGRFHLEGRLEGSRLRLEMDVQRGRLNIEGPVRDGRFEGRVRQPSYDVTQPLLGGRRQGTRPQRYGTIYAERQEAPTPETIIPDLDCPTLTPTGLRPCN